MAHVQYTHVQNCACVGGGEGVENIPLASQYRRNNYLQLIFLSLSPPWSELINLYGMHIQYVHCTYTVLFEENTF
jgi:hypothetical protein